MDATMTCEEVSRLDELEFELSLREIDVNNAETRDDFAKASGALADWHEEHDAELTALQTKAKEQP